MNMISGENFMACTDRRVFYVYGNSLPCWIQ